MKKELRTLEADPAGDILRHNYPSGDPVANKILAAMAGQPWGISRTKIRDLFSRHKPSREVSAVLKSLQKTGVIAAWEFREWPCRPTTYWGLSELLAANTRPAKGEISRTNLNPGEGS